MATKHLLLLKQSWIWKLVEFTGNLEAICGYHIHLHIDRSPPNQIRIQIYAEKGPSLPSPTVILAWLARASS